MGGVELTECCSAYVSGGIGASLASACSLHVLGALTVAMTEDDHLIHAIAYAMVFKGKLPIRPKGGLKPGIAEHTDVARAVVAHLRAAGYLISKAPAAWAGPSFHGRTRESKKTADG
jgi:hypothetical protein